MNWGWGGVQDGYYHLPNDTEYREDVKVIYGIYPNL